MITIDTIKGNLFPSRNSYELMTKLLNSDLEWLFEQVEKLPKELKHKKGVPTVIEYQGKRYILDMKG